MNTVRQIPALPGTYVLLLTLLRCREIQIGKLGLRVFQPGWYAYVGSAMGPGGLAARLSRHIRLDKKYHWHIDYLRAAAKVTGAWVHANPRPREHTWPSLLSRRPFHGKPVDGFGATDCACGSHLFFFPRQPNPLAAGRRLGAQWIELTESDSGTLIKGQT